MAACPGPGLSSFVFSAEQAFLSDPAGSDDAAVRASNRTAEDALMQLHSLLSVQAAGSEEAKWHAAPLLSECTARLHALAVRQEGAPHRWSAPRSRL